MNVKKTKEVWELPKDPTRFAADNVKIILQPKKLLDSNFTMNYCRYYDLETFLFEDVTKRFDDDGSIGAFDLFSIVIWKANRAKSKTAKRLRNLAKPGETLDALCHHHSQPVM